MSQSKQDKRNQHFVSAEIHRGSLGIATVFLPCEALREYFYRLPPANGRVDHPTLYDILRVPVSWLGSRYYQKTIRFLWRVQETLEKEFVLSLPYARFRALKHTADHLRGTVRIESATSIEPGVAYDLGSLAYCLRDVDAVCVAVHASCKAPRVIRILAKSPAPHATETCHRN